MTAYISVASEFCTCNKQDMMEYVFSVICQTYSPPMDPHNSFYTTLGWKGLFVLQFKAPNFWIIV